ncbi:hypothetical protein [Paraburkholderia domus]|uniref:hypothetical protein n=1 Tax=Paraburkholderia domus TaxID=2793075 RepID=UPI00191312E6|nr:hypothetical protein [Paraburkholderia domus]MBK5058824.1 hypothetical protein [Burkholderia sp. R-70199]CAE6878863.1 hypothetical protein R70199_02389 [Paraburkholderia domus]
MSRAAAIGLVAFALSNPAFSETIKLACHFNEVVSFPSGHEDTHSGKVVLQIETENGMTMISGDGTDLSISVGNFKAGSVIDLQDASDAGKWDITNTFQSGWTSEVVIDRNTGDFNYHRFKTRSDASRDATGTCKKVNLASRKF